MNDQETFVRREQLVGSKPLKEILDQPLGIVDFLRYAKEMTLEVSKAHQSKMVHRGLRPEAFAVVPETCEARIIDFSTATLLPREIAPLKPTDVLASSECLPYLSPEQTGRMNRTVDYRTDLYSLGIILYRMLCGKLPFRAKTPSDWVYAHVALVPEDPSSHRGDIPEPLSRILLKLLSKAAEDRYQSANGLRHDLERCLETFRKDGGIPPFALATHDVSDQFRIPEALYGREKDREALLREFDRVVETRSAGLLLVHGHSGIGKSSLVRELQPRALQAQGRFIFGKCDLLRRNVPYSSIAAALGQFARQLLGESEASLSEWRDKLRSGIGESARIVTDLVPEFELVLGRQPEIPKLPPLEAQNRFNRVFSKLIHVIADAGTPVAVFIDDLQWADSGTLALLKMMVESAKDRPFLLVGAYRSNEVPPGHPLHSAIEGIRQGANGLQVREISLLPLDKDCVHRLLADIVQSSAPETQALASIVHEKTEGNPFFVREFLTALQQRGLIWFDHAKSRWEWDSGKIGATEITGNVVELMLDRMRSLPVGTQRMLQHAAALGTRFTLPLLASTAGVSLQKVVADCWEAFKAGLLHSTADFFRLYCESKESGADPAWLKTPLGEERFAHDRVQQAAYQLIPEPSRAGLHLRIARNLRDASVRGVIQTTSFELASQYNLALSLVTERDERLVVAEINLAAARESKQSTAYASAWAFAERGITALGEEPWEFDRLLSFALHLERAESEFLAGKSDKAFSDLEQCLAEARNRREKVAALRLRLKILEREGKFDLAIGVAKNALELFSIHVPGDAAGMKKAQTAEYDAFVSLTAGKPLRETFLALKENHDPENEELSQLLSDAVILGFFRDFDLFTFLTNRMVNLALQNGLSKETPYALALFSPLPRLLHSDYEKSTILGKTSMELLDSIPGARHRSRVIMLYPTWVSFWSTELRPTLPLYRLGKQAGTESGDLTWAAYNSATSARYAYWAGCELVALEKELADEVAYARDLKQPIMEHQTRLVRRMVLELIHPPGSPVLEDSKQDVQECIKQFLEAHYLHGLGVAAVVRCHAQLILGRLPEAKESLKNAKSYLANFTLGFDYPMHVYLEGLILALEAGALRGKALEYEEIAAIDSSLQSLKLWSELVPANFLHKYLLLKAERSRLHGDAETALQEYRQSAAHASRVGCLFDEALACELGARFCAEQGLQTEAAQLTSSAIRAYRDWGAEAKARQLEATNQSAKPNDAAPLPDPTTFEKLDLLAVLRNSRAISGELVLPRLLKATLDVMIESTAARRGAFVLRQDQALVVAAESDLPASSEARDPALLECANNLPVALLQYSARSRKRINSSEEPGTETPVIDPYLSARRPKSFLCAPIIRREQILGVLYLENEIAPDIFSPSRLAVLDLLLAQSAISIENALLYSDLEKQAKERTHQLTRTQNELQGSLKLLHRSTRFVALGEATWGIAQEFNGFLDTIQLSIRQISELAKTGQLTPERLERLTSHNQSAIDRAAAITRGLLAAAKDGEGDPFQSCSLRSVVEDTLLLCAERMKRNGIEILLEFQDREDPFEVRCRTAEVSQALLCLLRPSQRTATSQETRRIRITIGRLDDQSEIVVANNTANSVFLSEESEMDLLVSRGLIERQGGALLLEPSPTGTRFVIRLA